MTIYLTQEGYNFIKIADYVGKCVKQYLVKFGAGNTPQTKAPAKPEDIDKNIIRLYGSRKLSEIYSYSNPSVDRRLVQIASTILMKGGNCGEHAQLTSYLCQHLFGPSFKIAQCSYPTIDHAFTLLCHEGDKDNNQFWVFVDPWPALPDSGPHAVLWPHSWMYNRGENLGADFIGDGVGHVNTLSGDIKPLISSIDSTLKNKDFSFDPALSGLITKLGGELKTRFGGKKGNFIRELIKSSPSDFEDWYRASKENQAHYHTINRIFNDDYSDYAVSSPTNPLSSVSMDIEMGSQLEYEAMEIDFESVCSEMDIE